MTDESSEKRRGGRPRGSGQGETPIRHVRIGPLWERAERLALEVARRDGTVRRRTRDGVVVESGNVSALVEEALRREVARLERLVAKPGEKPAS